MPSTLVQLVKGLRSQASQHFSIRPLCLAVAPGVCHGSKTDLAAEVLNILHEGVACELRAVVGDDPVRDPETANNRPEEFDRGLRRHLPRWFHFWPLCELVDCNVQVLKAPDSAGERARREEWFEGLELADEASLNGTDTLHTW